MNEESDDPKLRELFAQSQPELSPVDIDSIVAQTHDQEPATSRVRSNQQSRRWKMSIRAAAVLSVVASLFYFFVIPFASNDAVAFADVKAQIERIRTVDFLQTSHIVREDGTTEGHTTLRIAPDQTAEQNLENLTDAMEKLAVSGSNEQERADAKRHLQVLKMLSKEGPNHFSKTEDVRRIRIKGKHLQRTDHLYPIGRMHDVRSATTGLDVSYRHETKKRSVYRKQVVINAETGETKEHDIKKIPPTVDFFARFRKIPEDATEQLPKQQIDGKEAIGFRSVEKHENGTWTRTYWVQPDSLLPVRIVTDFKSTREKLASSRWVQSDFVFDSELDDGLFSTDTPDGYTSEDAEILGLE